MDCSRLRSLSVVESPTGIIATFSGPLNAIARPGFDMLLDRITPDDPPRVVLDLGATERLDESGLPLVRALAEAAGSRLEIRAAPGGVAEALGRAGLAFSLGSPLEPAVRARCVPVLAAGPGFP